MSEAGGPGSDSRPLLHYRSTRRLALIGFLTGSGFGVTLGALPLFIVSTGHDTSVAGLATTILLVACVIVQVFVPTAMRAFGAGPTLAVGLVLTGLPTLSLLVDHSLFGIATSSVVRGAGLGAVTVAAGSLTATLVPPHRRGEVTGLVGVLRAAPIMLGVLAGVALTQAGHFPVVAVLAISTVVGAPLAWRIEAHGDFGRSAERPRSVAGAPHRETIVAVLGPAVTVLVVCALHSGVATYLPLAARSGRDAPIALLFVGLGSPTGRWQSGRVKPDLRLVARLTTVSALSAAGLLLIATGLVVEHNRTLLFAGAAVLGLAFGAVNTFGMVLAFWTVPHRDAATISAAHAS